MFDVGVGEVDAPSPWLDDHTAAHTTELAISPADQVLDLIAGTDRTIGQVQAQQLRALARFADLRPGDPFAEFAPDELAPVLRVSRGVAERRLRLAVALVRRLPATLLALEHGELDLAKAALVVELTEPLSDRQAAQVEGDVLAGASTQTGPQLRQTLRRAVLRADPDGAQARHQHRLADRAVSIRPAEDGMANLVAYLAATDAEAIFHRISELARAGASGDTRTMDQRRTDVFVDVMLGRTSGGPARATADIQVTVAASTLLGLDDQPAELAGYGPITAQMARDLAADGTWRRILTDPATGSVLEVGRRTYRPPSAMVDQVRARDRTCRFPGCRQPARRCDIDHGLPYPHGPTSPCNLSCLCRHHHRLKHEAGWQLLIQPDGVLTWVSPTGRRYDTAPPALLP